MPRISLFGAAPDTNNLGVSAMFASVISGIWQCLPTAEFIVYDNGFGCRHSTLDVSKNAAIDLINFGARSGRRYYRPENLATMTLASRLGPIGAILNQGIRLIDSCDAVLDVSGGDSFSDIYGRERFFAIVRPKLIARNRGVPVILLPQTYGPYNDSGLRDIAAKAVRSSEMAWARDQYSFAVLKDLLGDEFDPKRHHCGVDLAFGLWPSDALHVVDKRLRSWIERDGFDGLLVGFNISGLIYNSPDKAVSEYGFRADYRRTIIDFLTWVLEQGDTRVVLIPHVMNTPDHYESDLRASLAVVEELSPRFGSRAAISPGNLDQSQAKWVISKMDWFCGTRMHSTIAALSSGVAATCIAYSDKAKGVFESCGLGEHVIDPRALDAGDVVSNLKRSFESRDHAQKTLLEHLPAVNAQVEEQMKVIAERVTALSKRRSDRVARLRNRVA